MFVAASDRRIRYQDIAALHEGDYFRDGKLYDCDGKEVQVAEPEDHHDTPPAHRVKVAAASSHGH
ncbi:hypothetical protein D3C78_1920380 [compost metagenome]